MRIFTPFLLATGLLAAAPLFAADTPAASPSRKVAIIVENRAGAQLNDKIPVLEDLLTSRIAGKGYTVISREVTVDAMKMYPVVGVAASAQTAITADAGGASKHNSWSTESAQADAAQTAAIHAKAGNGADANSASLTAGQTGSAQMAATQSKADSTTAHGSASVDLTRSDSAQLAVTPEATKLDQMLSDNTSALRLAQTLGADFILIPSITTYGTEKKTYSGEGIATINVIHNLRVSYKIVDAGAGGAIKGGTAIASKTIRQSGSLQVEDGDVINELLDDAADQLADTLVQNAGSLPAEVAKDKMVSFRIACTMTDPRQQPILISPLGLTADRHVVLTNPPVALQPLDVTVELDGIAIGSAPGSFQGFPGLHKLRLSREGFDPWERTVNIYDGQTLRVALQMSPGGYARWKDTTDFLATLDSNRILTDAEAKRLEGMARFFNESHYRVDTKENVKVYKSLF
ncbi:MAG: PEGA domain-containing protein [Verrucomicrobiia bacterium]